MKRLLSAVPLLPLALLIGCGSAKVTLFNTRDVARAFLLAGVPFQQELRPPVSNPYLRTPPGFVAPFTQLGGGGKGLQAILIAANATTYNGEYAYVFDSKADANAALKADEIKHGAPAIVAQRQNVVVLYVPYQGQTFARRVRRALASLR